MSAEDAAQAAREGGILGGKLHDLAIIYSEYEKYLEESGKKDRNAYLRELRKKLRFFCPFLRFL